MLAGLLDTIGRSPAFRRLVVDLERLPPGGSASGSFFDAAKPGVVAALGRALRLPVVVVTGSASRARQLAEQTRLWYDEPNRVFLFAEPDALFYERLAPDRQTNQARLEALLALASAAADGGVGASSAAAPPIVIASARALMHPLMAAREFADSVVQLTIGSRFEPNDLVAACLRLGYQPAPVVDEPGTYSLRGGIFDVFPPTYAWPVRIEFFDDEIDSLRTFDPVTQRSRDRLDALTLAPAAEVLADLGGAAARAIGSVDLDGCDEETRAEWERDVARLAASQSFAGLEFYAPFLASASLFDYVAGRGLVVVDEPDQVGDTVRDVAAQAEAVRGSLVERGRLPATYPVPYLSWDVLAERLVTTTRFELTWHERDADDEDDRAGTLGDVFAPAAPYGGRLKLVLDDCQKMLAEGRRVVIISQQSQRLAELLAERDLLATPRDAVDEPPPPRSLTLVHGTVSEGFTVAVPEASLVLLTDFELFGWAKPRRAIRPKAAPRDNFLSDLTPGDYVVHVEHGVGRFRGLHRMAPDGIEREYLWIDYVADDRLFVPIEQADRVSRYVGAGDLVPTMHRLGTTEWARVKERVKAAVRDMAEELLALYAARAARPGHQFTPDGTWQRELEDAFPYVETPDQLRAISDVKADMEKPKPMDRLLCGDVGYGKTEVALRAAFKAVMDGKQVAVLVPTTVLAQQHFNTFTERMQAFPVTIDMLSRFRSPREQARIVADLAAGKIDICIGTHRLIQKDVVFKELGLVIIDEEQRFGVAHKERLKQLRQQVDVLTLTATPIPRTLHMALAGARDMSTMETAPEDRLPVRTYVEEWDDALVREAILREVERGGQVYVLHNRVQSIYQVQQRLQKLVPEASFVVGHGQQPEETLERVMVDFANGTYDVLVCTTIIESGLDIPNVNTIVIDQADKLGLAQLYQLRGRVGRGANRAYCYLMYRRDKQLSEIADKRLKAIFEATELGAGFRIAMRDLELRGAGNLLGAEQSGQIAAVGFHLYTRLLAEAVHELQGTPDERLPEVSIDLPVRALIPADYVEDEQARLNLYQRLATATMPDHVGSIVLELRDRFGALPDPVLDLVYLVQLKIASALAGVAAISATDREIVLRFHVENRERGQKLTNRFGPLVKAGRTHVYVDRDALGANWQPVLQEMLETIELPAAAVAVG